MLRYGLERPVIACFRHVIDRSRMIGWRYIFGVARRWKESCLSSQLSSSNLVENTKLLLSSFELR